MAWLIAHMWAPIGLAALAGLLIGWSIRGIGISPKRKNAGADEDLEAEVIRLREENAALNFNIGGKPIEDALNKADANGGEKIGSLRGELDAAKSELAKLQAELEKARSGGGVTAAAAGAVGAVAGAVASQAVGGDSDVDLKSENDASVEWRNKYLESRVRYLESKLSGDIDEDGDVPQAPVTADTSALEAEIADLKAKLAAAGTTAAAVAGAASSDDADGQELSKLRWQNRYLQSRLNYFEDHDTSEDIPYDSSVQPEVAAAPSGDVSEEPEDELAKLRWRNRYLEGRLKYLEGGEGDAASNDAAAATATAVAATAAAAVATAPKPEPEPAPAATPEPEPAPAAAAPEPEPEPAPEPVAEAATEPAPEPTPEPVAAAAAPQPSFGVAEGQEIRPPFLDAPRDGQPDNLGEITGIGPETQAYLKEIGIFHFDQIASWSPEEAAWVEGFLRLRGRVQEEDWIGQAKSKSG